eukprot:196644-Prorocentrum_minimum.AAC.4
MGTTSSERVQEFRACKHHALYTVRGALKSAPLSRSGRCGLKGYRTIRGCVRARVMRSCIRCLRKRTWSLTQMRTISPPRTISTPDYKHPGL